MIYVSLVINLVMTVFWLDRSLRSRTRGWAIMCAFGSGVSFCAAGLAVVSLVKAPW